MSILEPYKCQIAKKFWGFAPNPIGSLQSMSPNPAAPKIRKKLAVNCDNRKAMEKENGTGRVLKDQQKIITWS